MEGQVHTPRSWPGLALPTPVCPALRFRLRRLHSIPPPGAPHPPPPARSAPRGQTSLRRRQRLPLPRVPPAAPGRRYPLPPHPPGAAPLSRGPPHLVPGSRSHSAFPGVSPPGSPRARPTRGGCPTPFALPGSLGRSCGSLDPATSGPAVPAANPFANRGRRHSPRAPISAPRRAAQRAGARPAPAPRALIPGSSWGRAAPQAGGGGSLSRGWRAGGSG